MFETPFHQKDISNTSFLITGGAGFIGSNIVDYLLKYNAKKVRVLDNLSTGFEVNLEKHKENDRFEFFKGDISRYQDCLEALQNIDFVSHQAALGSVPRSLANPIANNESNVTGFLNLISAARERQVKRIVYASSSSVYGDSADLPKKEESIGNPLSPYAVSKYTNELYARVAYLNYGQEIIGLRYFNVFGPHQSPKGAYAAVIPLFIEALQKKQAPFINGNGEQSRDFTFVENAVQANVKALLTENKEAFGEVFNIGYGKQYSLLELYDLIKNQIGVEVAPVHREERKGDVKHSLADISKAKKTIEYNPQINLVSGLKQTIEWFSKKGKV